MQGPDVPGLVVLRQRLCHSVCMRVLLGNEFGQGFGHAKRLLAIAQHLQQAAPNLEARLVLPNRPGARLPTVHGIGMHLADVLHHQRRLATPWSNFGAAMADCLLGEEGVLQTYASFWEVELASFKPDLVLADFAPVLCMMARGRVPVLATGSGYTLPPDHMPQFPDLRSNGVPLPMAEDDCVAEINRVLRRHDAHAISRLTELNAATARAVMTIPVFDPYWQTRADGYLGVEHPGGSPRPGKAGQGVAVYFSTPKQPAIVIEALQASGLNAEVYMPGHTSKAERLQWRDMPFNLARELPRFACVLHEGTLGMAAAAMYAGIPQVSLYNTDEQQSHWKAMRMADIGNGTHGPTATLKELTALLMDSTGNARMRNFACALSERYAAFRDSSPSAAAARLALSLV